MVQANYQCRECRWFSTYDVNEYKEHIAHCCKEESKMKTYSGELKTGMPYSDSENWELGSIFTWKKGYTVKSHIKWVHVDNEWQRYEPKPKKVWDVPAYHETYYALQQYDRDWVAAECIATTDSNASVYLNKHTAEQHAKALNYINEFRALSDVPVDDVTQWYIDPDGDIFASKFEKTKLSEATFGYLADSEEKIKRDRAAFPKIALANKIVTWGFHGIIEEVL